MPGNGNRGSNEVSWLRVAVADGVPRRSLYVAIVVGTVLNLINQGDALLAGESLDYLKLVLTYAVPYLVATYGAVTMCLHARRGAQGEALDP